MTREERLQELIEARAVHLPRGTFDRDEVAVQTAAAARAGFELAMDIMTAELLERDERYVKAVKKAQRLERRVESIEARPQILRFGGA